MRISNKGQVIWLQQLVSAGAAYVLPRRGGGCRDVSPTLDGVLHRRQNGAMNRSADWLDQAQADLELAGVSAAAGYSPYPLLLVRANMWP